jgi:hypothetical protein
MINFIINLVELVIVTKVVYKVGKFFLAGKFGGKKKYKRSISRKILLLMRNKANDVLNDMLKVQRQKRLAKVKSQQAQDNENVVDFKSYKRAKAR